MQIKASHSGHSASGGRCLKNITHSNADKHVHGVYRAQTGLIDIDFLWLPAYPASRAMTPSQFDLFIRRLIIFGAPKASHVDGFLAWISFQTNLHGLALSNQGAWDKSGGDTSIVYCLEILSGGGDAHTMHLLVGSPKARGRSISGAGIFSGVGRIAALAKYSGFKVAAVDLEYGVPYAQSRGPRTRSPMDLNSSAGLLLRACSDTR